MCYYETVVIFRDFNIPEGNYGNPDIRLRLQECVINDKGELMNDVCSFKNLKSKSTSFDHKPQ